MLGNGGSGQGGSGPVHSGGGLHVGCSSDGHSGHPVLLLYFGLMQSNGVCLGKPPGQQVG